MKNRHMAGIAAVALLAGAWAWPPSAGPGALVARGATSGDLTKPIDQYTGDEFYNFTRGLNYVQGPDRQRRCRGNAACAGAQRTLVRPDAVADVDSLSQGNLPQYGVVAARVIVRGNDADAMYGMQPNGADGRYSYYLIVMPGSSWRLEELNVQGTNRTHRMLATGRFTACNHPYVRGARADFKTCAEASASARQGAVIFRPASFGSLSQGSGEPPLWIGCASGCCTAEG